MRGKMLNPIVLGLVALLFPVLVAAHHMGSGNAPDAVDGVAHGAAAQSEQTGPGENVSGNAETEQGSEAGETGNTQGTGGGDGGAGRGPDRS